MMNSPLANSYIYTGKILHRRYIPKEHSFIYSLYMLAIDVADIEKMPSSHGLFGFNWYNPLRFCEKDYLKGDPLPLKERIKDKVIQLNGHKEISKIVMLVQTRCFGLYFSPANFYFCFDKNDLCTQMLVEVSNTPWNERHYYLVNLSETLIDLKTKKQFQVSPFMEMEMDYFWKVKPPLNTNISINIENRKNNSLDSIQEKVFTANLAMTKIPFTKKNISKTLCAMPFMTLKIVLAIYWQALRLLFKRIPFLGYQN